MHIPHPFPDFGRNQLNVFLLEEDWNGAIVECESRRREAKMWSTRSSFSNSASNSNFLPLHVACSRRAPLNVVDAILQAHPRAVEMTETTFKRLPLHIACQFEAHPDIIELLLTHNPQGSLQPDNLARLPIHYACSNGAHPEVVKLLLASNPMSAMFADGDGWNALHIACHFGVNTEAIREILRVCPESVLSITRKGSTPLKLANRVNWKNKAEVVALLEDVKVRLEESRADLDFLNRSKSLFKSMRTTVA